jgi:hypothetical protein
MRLTSRPQFHISLAFYPSEIRIAKVTKHRNRYSIPELVTIDIGHDLNRALSPHLDASGLVPRLTLLFNHPDVLIKYIPFASKLSDYEYYLDLKENLYQHFPVEEELVFDFHKINPQKILLVAAKKKQIQTSLSYFNNKQLPLHIIDVDTFAIIRGIYFLYPDLDKDLVILNCELSFTQLILVMNGNLIFCETLADDINDLETHVNNCLVKFNLSLSTKKIRVGVLAETILPHVLLSKDHQYVAVLGGALSRFNA